MSMSTQWLLNVGLTTISGVIGNRQLAESLGIHTQEDPRYSEDACVLVNLKAVEFLRSSDLFRTSVDKHVVECCTALASDEYLRLLSASEYTAAYGDTWCYLTDGLTVSGGEPVNIDQHHMQLALGDIQGKTLDCVHSFPISLTIQLMA